MFAGEKKRTAGGGHFLAALGTAILSLTAQHAHGQIVASGFDADTEGWTIQSNNGGCAIGALSNPAIYTWVPTGGNPGGYFFRSAETPGITTGFFRAPAAYHGDLSAALGGLLVFDLRQSGTDSQFDNADVILRGNGVALFYNTPFNPKTTWTHYEVPLRPNAGWRVGSCTGAVATQADMLSVLGSVTDLLIRGEFRSGSDTCALDSVAVLPSNGSTPPLSDSFDAGTEGWWVQGDGTPSWSSTDGVPPGCLRGVDQTAGVGYSFVAPSKYLGDRTALIGRSLLLNFKASPNADFMPNLGMIFLSNGVVTITYVSPTPVTGNVWKSYAVPLIEGRAWRRTDTGQPATIADLTGVLGALSVITIRCEYTSGSESEYLDNFVLGSCAPSAFNEGSAPACVGSPATLHVATGGDMGLTYAWRKNSSPIDPISNPSALSATLVVPNVEPGDAGSYDCIVTNTCGSVTSNAAILTVRPVNDPACGLFCDPDFNQDGNADQSDIDYLINAVAGGANPTGREPDFNQDGNLDQSDVDALINVVAGGDCP